MAVEPPFTPRLSILASARAVGEASEVHEQLNSVPWAKLRWPCCTRAIRGRRGVQLGRGERTRSRRVLGEVSCARPRSRRRFGWPRWMLRTGGHLFFFFKQKTAYEI